MKPETKFPSDRVIQGLHDKKNAEANFWTLKAKIDLAIFRENEKEKKTYV
jgi:hypothetical protein